MLQPPSLLCRGRCAAAALAGGTEHLSSPGSSRAEAPSGLAWARTGTAGKTGGEAPGPARCEPAAPGPFLTSGPRLTSAPEETGSRLGLAPPRPRLPWSPHTAGAAAAGAVPPRPGVPALSLTSAAAAEDGRGAARRAAASPRSAGRCGAFAPRALPQRCGLAALRAGRAAPLPPLRHELLGGCREGEAAVEREEGGEGGGGGRAGVLPAGAGAVRWTEPRAPGGGGSPSARGFPGRGGLRGLGPSCMSALPPSLPAGSASRSGLRLVANG